VGVRAPTQDSKLFLLVGPQWWMIVLNSTEGNRMLRATSLFSYCIGASPKHPCYTFQIPLAIWLCGIVTRILVGRPENRFSIPGREGLLSFRPLVQNHTWGSTSLLSVIGTCGTLREGLCSSGVQQRPYTNAEVVENLISYNLQPHTSDVSCGLITEV
jgi:hypothetical protein